MRGGDQDDDEYDTLFEFIRKKRGDEGDDPNDRTIDAEASIADDENDVTVPYRLDEEDGQKTPLRYPTRDRIASSVLIELLSMRVLH